MAFNPLQFKQKKKRPVDPNAPPRPNLLSQDKKLREQQAAFERVLGVLERQQTEIETLKTNYRNLQMSVEQLINYVRNKK